MQFSRKKTVAVVLLSILFCGIAFALLSNYYEFTNTVNIKGVGVKLWHWIDDSTPPTELVTNHDWGTLAGGEVAYFEYVILENYGTEDITLAFSTDLDGSIGTVKWEIEAYVNGVWEWKDWEQAIADGINYIPGHSGNPMEPGMLGQRPASPQELDVGRIRIVLTIASNAPFGSADPFTITVTGTEYQG